MTEPATQTPSSHEIPEIGAFRYTASPEKAGLNPLNLAGLPFGQGPRPLSDRLLDGVRFWVRFRPEAPAPEPTPSSDGMSVFKYHLPLQDYRARRRRAVVLARRLAMAGALVVALPLGYTLIRHAPAPKAPARISDRVQGPVQAPQPAGPASEVQTAAVTPPQAAPGEAGPTTYVVQDGDTLSEIAHRFHVKRRALIEANDLSEKRPLRIGHTLQIPARVAAGTLTSASALAAHEASGAAAAVGQAIPLAAPEAARPVANPAQSAAKPARQEAPKPRKRTKRTTYVVQEGDTLSEIAERFGVKTGAIVEVNDLDFHTRLRIGRKIVVPPNAGPDRDYRGRETKKSASRGLLGDLGRLIAKQYLWPTSGRVSSNFGERGHRFHSGLDIANEPGAPIRATKPGVVVAAGWDGDYGRKVDISHGNGVVTRYAHCSKLLVRAGERVEQGEVIARVGETGHATGPHLHFEVRVNGRPVDPERFF